MKTSLKTAPATEPVSSDEFKLHQRISGTTENDLITSILKAARSHVEYFTGRALITQTWYAYLDDFPAESYIELPWGELQSVTSVKYKNSSGDETTMTVTTDYLVDSSSEPGKIVLPYLVSWPSFTAYPYNAVTIEYICGYGAATAVPDALKAAIKLIAGDLYENREAQTISNIIRTFVANPTATNLMEPYRLRMIY